MIEGLFMDRRASVVLGDAKVFLVTLKVVKTQDLEIGGQLKGIFL